MTTVGTREAGAEPIPGYRLLAPLGSGGFGEVWKCEAPGGLLKAIKFIRGGTDVWDADNILAVQELQALHRVREVRHPFILSIERVEEVAGELIIVTELADCSLLDRLRECQQRGLRGIPRDELLAYLRDAAEALDFMNFQHDLQHLDIKPGNLLLVGNRVKVADFGLVKELEGRRAGGLSAGLAGGLTPMYAAPETFQGIISRHSDQYSLAIVYQELLTGRRPFEARTPREYALKHTREDPDVSPLDPAERAVIARALAKNPRERFPSCLALIRALVEAGLPGELVQAGQPIGPSGRTPVVQEQPRSPRAGLPETLEDVFLPRAVQQAVPAAAVESAVPSVTVAQPASGCLRPALIIGLGELGGRVLRQIRCRFLDRFHSLQPLRMVALLHIDTDENSLRQSTAGPPEQALALTETYHMPLQPVGYYRRSRALLDELLEWLPLDKLYALPRSLQTNGMRALGRLAFVDNYLRLAARLKRELQAITHADALFETVRQTGLALKAETPQVVIVCGAGGGCSGMLLDLAYLVRRLLKEQGFPQDDIVAFLVCAATVDPVVSPRELANMYATLTEVHHFSDPHTSFLATYGPGGPVCQDGGRPFQAVYLTGLPQPSKRGVERAIAQTATYIYQDLTTPLGQRLTGIRARDLLDNRGVFRSFGGQAVWFPRGLLLRLAARQIGARLLQHWLEKPLSEEDQAALHQQVAALCSTPDWQPDALGRAIEEASAHDEDSPAQALNDFLMSLEKQLDSTVARDDPLGWCRQVLEKVRDWAGSSEPAGSESWEWRRSRLHRHLAAAAQTVAATVAPRLLEPAISHTDRPNARLPAAEKVLTALTQWLQEQRQHVQTLLDQMSAQAHHYRRQMELALDGCLGAAPPLMGMFGISPARKPLRVFLDRVAAYCRHRVSEETLRAIQHCLSLLEQRVAETRRELHLSAERLCYLADQLVASIALAQESFAEGQTAEGTESLRLSYTSLVSETAQHLASRVVLPAGPSDLEQAVAAFTQGLPENLCTPLDEYVQRELLAPVGGLARLLGQRSDLAAYLGEPLVDHVAHFLEQYLPSLDVCAAELSATRQLELDLPTHLATLHREARPNWLVSGAEDSATFLVLHDSEAGHELEQAARTALGRVQVIRTPYSCDLYLCRDAVIPAAALQLLLATCREAYRATVVQPGTSPHARCDIVDWLPLEP